MSASSEATQAEGLLLELYDWALDACHQGTGRPYGSPEWHLYMSVWTQAENLLPRVAAALGLQPPSAATGSGTGDTP